MALDPDMVKVLERMGPHCLSGLEGLPPSDGIALMRVALPPLPSAWPQVRIANHRVSGTHGEIPVRLYWPRQGQPRGAFLFLHGGLSTGPRTTAGLAHSRRARWKHGARSAETAGLRCAACAHFRRVRTLLTAVRASAGHGVLRSVFAHSLLSRVTPLLAPDSASPRLGVSAVNPVPAWHGVHRHFSIAAPRSVDAGTP